MAEAESARGDALSRVIAEMRVLHNETHRGLHQLSTKMDEIAKAQQDMCCEVDEMKEKLDRDTGSTGSSNQSKECSTNNISSIQVPFPESTSLYENQCWVACLHDVSGDADVESKVSLTEREHFDPVPMGSGVERSAPGVVLYVVTDIWNVYGVYSNRDDGEELVKKLILIEAQEHGLEHLSIDVLLAEYGELFFVRDALVVGATWKFPGASGQHEVA